MADELNRTPSPQKKKNPTKIETAHISAHYMKKKKNVKTNIRKILVKLTDKQFTKSIKLYIRNTLKLTYSCTKKIQQKNQFIASIYYTQM